MDILGTANFVKSLLIANLLFFCPLNANPLIFQVRRSVNC
jgi:hypothetical protein